MATTEPPLSAITTTAEPPPKKRKILACIDEPSSPSSSSSCQEEIARKSRNKEELRALLECYKRIRVCVERNDPRLMPDLEQAYLSIVAASKGCSSVQRIVAELIPRYASYCPTALEAATKVSIKMYNWSLSLISKGENTDKSNSAFNTAKACIIGLAEICHLASHEVPSSSVMFNISTSVFSKVLTFFASSFEGNDIYQFGRNQIEKLQDHLDFLYEMKVENEENGDEDKLFEIRVLSFLSAFFSSPSNLIEACFIESDNLSNEGLYFINQICHDFEERDNDGTISTNCLLKMVINKDPTFKSWIISKHKNLNPISEISSQIGRILSSFPEIIEEKESEDIPMDITEESPKNPPPKETEENIPTNNNATCTPLKTQNQTFDFTTNAVSSFVISASKELWVSYLNTNASEPSLESKFLEFGPITNFLIYPHKKFALIEYQSIHDSIKAHGFMQGSSIFNGSIKVKFLDRGLGTRGFAEGVAIGDSCFVYVGNVLSQHERDEILGELTGFGSRLLPVSVRDLVGENAVLLEFGSAEEAAIAKARIRARNESVGASTPSPQVFRNNWSLDPVPHSWPHRSHPVFAPPVIPTPPPPYHASANQISPRVITPGGFRTPLPFIPSSVTPLSQMSQIAGACLQNFVPPPPPIIATFLPPAQLVQNIGEPTNIHKWRGVLSKSGVNYCTVYAVREESDACRYINCASEPKDWPSKLDVTKRTDIKNVRTTFSNVLASKREVCRLLPMSTSDQKGFGDFISYLKQRDCAGVIKIPGIKPMWSRLLFILPHSVENCAMLGINPSPSDCLIALVLPKDTSSE